ncbi:MAG: cupin domain-containing protein [Pseudomonadota bacterium]
MPTKDDDDADPPIVNIDAVIADPAFRIENPARGGFQATIARIGEAVGTEKIGVNVTMVPAGAKAWPRHWHYGAEELFIVLTGAGTLHFGARADPIKAGDVVSIRANTGIPFQIENTGTEELRYLAVSTLEQPEVVVYPDSGKVGVIAGAPPLRSAAAAPELKRRQFFRAEDAVGYWTGETED